VLVHHDRPAPVTDGQGGGCPDGQLAGGGTGRGHGGHIAVQCLIEPFPARGQLIVKRSGADQPAAPARYAKRERPVDPQRFGLAAGGRVEGRLVGTALVGDHDAVEAEADRSARVDG
jgi:hypothetical protein